jgi:hypothetical protein
VELSGLIFVALALVWAVVLIPKALKHHDELAQTRSVEELSDDHRVIVRRDAAPQAEKRAPSAEGRTAAPPATRTGAPAGARAAAQTAARTAARRRRRVLGLLLVALGAVSTAAALGQLQPWAPAVPGAVVVGFLVLARVMVRRDRARRARRAAERRSAEARRTAVPAAAAAEPTARTEAAPAEEERNEQGLAVVSGLEHTSAVPLGLVAPTETTGSSVWDPLPMTLPTYVSKPRATRSVRTIDLTAPGVSSSGRDAAASALVAEAATSTGPEGPAQRAVGS